MGDKFCWMVTLSVLVFCILGVVPVKHAPNPFATSILEMWGIQLYVQGTDVTLSSSLPFKTRRAYEILKQQNVPSIHFEMGRSEICLKDPWGNYYHCKWRRKPETMKYCFVWSSGPDGIDDGGHGDDVVYPCSRDDWMVNEYRHVQIFVK